jgi:hypothetical protein
MLNNEIQYSLGEHLYLLVDAQNQQSHAVKSFISILIVRTLVPSASFVSRILIPGTSKRPPPSPILLTTDKRCVIGNRAKCSAMVTTSQVPLFHVIR